VIETGFLGLVHGFGVALEPHNLMWCFVGVLVGNMVGVLPGMGVLSCISILLPLTFSMQPVAALLMLSGIYYGAQYGGAICSILLNLPCHPPHAVTCLDGYPMTLQGRGGVALGAAFGPQEICTLMLLGLLAGATLAKGSAVKGVSMTLLGILLSLVGTDVNTGNERFTFGQLELSDGLELVTVSLGLFGIAEFLKSVNAVNPAGTRAVKLGFRDLRPSRADLRQALPPVLRGTVIGSLCSLIPGTGPTIASFIAYAAEKKISKTPGRFGHGAIEGVAAPEASTHSAVQGDFIPTMSLGIPGDAVMALLLGALMIHGIQPGPRLIVEQPDIFWGLIASFWIGNLILVFLNVPMIGIWVKLLSVPYRFLYPTALFFVCIGVFAARNEMFDVGATLLFGAFGYLLLQLGFEPAPILLGFVLGPRLEENFRRSVLLSRGSLATFVDRPISAVFVGLCLLLILAQVYAALRRTKPPIRVPEAAFD